MDPISLLLLQWQGVHLKLPQAWELISLREHQVVDYLHSLSLDLNPDWKETVNYHRELCRKNSILLVPFWHPHYPNTIKNLSKPPLLLSCRGDTSCMAENSIAVVGSRKLNHQSSLWMEQELSYMLRHSNFCVVSGGAYGTDQKAHTLSVLNQKPTLCWLPSGLLNLYPSSLRGLAVDIIESGGVLISTYPPKQAMRKFHFVQRNQFIAACALFTFIVQAKRKSGTLITAKAAADFGKEVAVLPASPNEEGLGGLDLLYEGAHIIRDGKDLLCLARNLMAEQASPFVNSKCEEE